jgi:hypothetical protein
VMPVVLDCLEVSALRSAARILLSNVSITRSIREEELHLVPAGRSGVARLN